MNVEQLEEEVFVLMDGLHNIRRNSCCEKLQLWILIYRANRLRIKYKDCYDNKLLEQLLRMLHRAYNKTYWYY